MNNVSNPRDLDRELSAVVWYRHPLVFLFGFMALAVVLACLLTPWVWLALHAFVERYPHLRPSDTLNMPRVLQRMTLLTLLLALIFSSRYCHTMRLMRDGFARVPGWNRHLLLGVVYALSTILALHVLLYLTGMSRPVHDFSWGDLLSDMAYGLLGVILIGLVEEGFFRGIVHRYLRGLMPLAFALVLSSAFYSSLHFINEKVDWEADAAHWYNGFVAAWVLLENLAGFDQMRRALGLFLLGGVLAIAYERSGRLYLPMALHAAWVWVIKWDGEVVRPMRSEWSDVWFGSATMIDGVAAQLLMLVSMLVMWRLAARLPGTPRGETRQAD